MIGGTTPLHTFRVPINTELIKSIKLTYTQLDEVVLTKRTEDFTIEEGQISVKLTQDDTFLFSHLVSVIIQLRIVTIDGDVLSNKPFSISVERCYDGEVLE